MAPRRRAHFLRTAILTDLSRMNVSVVRGRTRRRHGISVHDYYTRAESRIEDANPELEVPPYPLLGLASMISPRAGPRVGSPVGRAKDTREIKGPGYSGLLIPTNRGLAQVSLL